MTIAKRTAQLRHDTRAVHTAGVDPEIFWAYRPGDRVLTCDGILGTVESVLDGPVEGTEVYNVELDGGMGGGEYDEGKLAPAPGSRVAVKTAAATEQDEDEEGTPHLASEDYPELAEILVKRPPLEHAQRVGSKTADWVATDGQGNIVGGPYARSDEAADKHPGADIHPDHDEEPWAGWGTGQDADTADYPLNMNASATPVHIAGVMDTIVDGIERHVSPQNRFDPSGNWSFDWCRFRRRERCYYPKELDYEATRREGYSVWVPFDRGRCLRAEWDEQKKCPVGEPGPNSGEPNSLLDATIPYEAGGQRGGVPVTASVAASLDLPEPPPGDEGLITTAAADPEFRFEFTANWSDVQRKAKRIRSEGGVRIISASDSHIVAEVKGDGHVYQTTLMRQPGRKVVALWECGCAWSKYAWGRSGRWKRYEGRMCSHALALNYEAAAQEWMGGTLTEQPQAPEWSKGVKPTLPSRERPSAWQVGQPQRASLTTEAMAPIAANPSLEEIVSWYEHQSRNEEPHLTQVIEGLAVHNGGKAEGLSFRFKQPAKILDKIKRKNYSGDPRSWIDDALRYTIVFHPSIYSAQVQDTLYGLQEAGYTIKEESNSWLRGDPYSDLKYVFLTHSGMPFELQFHTAESLDLKERALHSLYEEFRDNSTPLARRQELFDIMTAYWEDVQIPEGVLEYPVERRYLRPVSVHASLQRPLAAVVKEAWSGQGVMALVRGRLVQILALLPGGMVRIQGGDVVPSHEVLHPKFDPIRGLSPRSAALTSIAHYDPANPSEGLRKVLEQCSSGKHTHSGLVIKAVDTGRVLLTQRTPYADDPEGVRGRWEFPGGGIEDGENPVASAVREFKEESGLDLPPDAVVDDCYENGKYVAIIVLVPNEAWTTNAQLLTFETMGIGWFSPDHIQGADIVREEMDATEWDMVREAVKTAAPADDAVALLSEAWQRGEVPEVAVTWFAPSPDGQEVAAEKGIEGTDVQAVYTYASQAQAAYLTADDARAMYREVYGDADPNEVMAAVVAEQEAQFAASEAILHDEPEPALPVVLGNDEPADPLDAIVQAAMSVNAALSGQATPAPQAGLEWLMQGGGGPAASQDASDIAAAAAQFLATGERPTAPGMARTAAKVFSPAEQQKIINEGKDVVASNLEDLDIAGTHYEALEANLRATDDDFLW